MRHMWKNITQKVNKMTYSMHAGTLTQLKRTRNNMEIKKEEGERIYIIRKNTIWKMNATIIPQIQTTQNQTETNKHKNKQEQSQFWETTQHIKI